MIQRDSVMTKNEPLDYVADTLLKIISNRDTFCNDDKYFSIRGKLLTGLTASLNMTYISRDQ